MLLEVLAGDVQVLRRDLAEVGKLARCLVAGHDFVDVAFVSEELFGAAEADRSELEALPFSVGVAELRVLNLELTRLIWFVGHDFFPY